MGSDGSDGSLYDLEDGLKKDIKDIGLKLYGLDFPTIDELLDLLERAKIILFEIHQDHSGSTKASLLPIATALKTDELLQHENVNVQIAVASCLNEFIRLSAPNYLFEEQDKMEACFKLFMVALKLLSDNSTSNHETPWRILLTMEKAKSCLCMMDYDSGGLVIEMFELFLNTISSDHPNEIYEHMQGIMTMVIEESDENEISLELVKPLLDSVRRDNKSISPISWELGRTVIEKCAVKLKPYLQEAVSSMNLVIEDYAEIVISLCCDTTKGETMDRKASQTLQSDVAVSNDEQRVLPNRDGVRPSMEHVAATVHSETDKISFQKRKDKKTNSRYELTGPSGSLRKESVTGACSSKGVQSKMKASLNDQPDDLEWSSSIRRKIKMGESSSGRKPSKTMPKKKLSRQKEKKPETSAVDYGEELLNLRIQVWWPMDKTFYTGTVTAFDPTKKKHTITYDDDELEVLKLKDETWELLGDEKPQETQSSQKVEETDNPPLPEEPAKRPNKTAKRKAAPSKDKHVASSSKRLERDSNNVLNPQRSSEYNDNHVIDIPEDEKVLQKN